MIARQWRCHSCGHTNYGSFSQGVCENCSPLLGMTLAALLQDFSTSLEPDTSASPMQVKYEALQAKLNMLHLERSALDVIIRSTVDEINELKRLEYERVSLLDRKTDR